MIQKKLRALWLTVALAAGLAAAPAVADSPAALADTSQHQAHAAFKRFAQSWMAKMKKAGEANRAKNSANYRGYGDDYKVELKPTGHASAPFVGILRYQEHQMRCPGGDTGSCKVAGRSAVTEIFRFQNGRWVY